MKQIPSFKMSLTKGTVYLKYNTDSKKLEWETDINQVSEFKVFWNVEK